MTLWRRSGRLAAALLGAAVLLRGQVSMEQAVGLALANNQELRALRQRIPEARGGVRQAGLRPNPSVDFSVGNGAVVRNPGYWDGAVGYTHTIEMGGKRARLLQVAEADVETARLMVRERERQLRARVQTAYVDALAAERNTATAEELLGLLDQSLRVVTARVEQGEAPALEVSLLKVEIGRARADRVLFAQQRDRALAELRLVTGMGAETLTDGLETADEATGGDAAQRADVELLRQMEKGSEAAVRLERSSAVPDVRAMGKFSYGYDYIQSVLGVPVVDRCPILTVGVSVDLPWKNRNQGNIEAAVARREGVKHQREYQETAAAAEARMARERWRAAGEAVATFEKEVLEQARSNLRVVRGIHEQGELRMLDVINEQRKLTDAQRTYTELLKEKRLALVELEKATGRP